MAVDSKYLCEHYASLSDQALLAINRADLVDTAQKCYDDEVARRERARPTIPDPPDAIDEDPEVHAEPVGNGERPEWLGEAAEVVSRYDRPGSVPSDDILDALDVLEAAGIPCYLDLFEEEKSSVPPPTHRWRVMVPGNLNLRATSVLQRDIFNQEFGAQWKAHLETLSDEELRGMKPEIAFCGLFDRVERVTRAYNDEIARRRL